MKFFAPTSLWRLGGSEFSAIAAQVTRRWVRACRFGQKASKILGKFWAAATDRQDPKTRATGSLLRTRRGTRVARGFARESQRTPGTDSQGEMGEVKLPEDVKEQLEKFEAAVQEMEDGLTPLLSADRKEMEAALNPLERARVHIALANAVARSMRVSKAAQRTGPVFSRRPPRPGETPRKSRLPAEHSPTHLASARFPSNHSVHQDGGHGSRRSRHLA